MRIVVVEDEFNSREGLVRLIGKLEGGYEVVGEADNGEAGIAVIERVKPDVIIADIKMPFMTGLEMLEKLKLKGVRHKTIILTGFSEFDYARKAIKLNVSDYLEKPITAADLREALAKVKHERLEDMQSDFSSEPESAETMLRKLAEGEAGDVKELMPILLQRWGLVKENPVLIIAYYFENLANTSSSHLVGQLARYWDAVSNHVEFELKTPKVIVSIVQVKDMGLDGVDYLNGNVINGLANQRYECVCSCVEKRLEELVNLKSESEKLLKLLNWSLVFGNKKAVLEEDVAKASVREQPYPFLLESNCSRAIISANGDELRKIFDSCMAELTNGKYSPSQIIEYGERYVSNLLRLAADLHDFKLQEPLQREWSSLLREVRTIGEFTRLWQEISSELAGFESKIEAQVNSLPVQKTVSIIHGRYSEGITIDEIADSLHITPGYLSSLFNKEVGQTFPSYIKDIRLKKAKELLLGSDLKMHEIARLIGYPDPKYFSRIFKDSTGMSPGEYQIMNRR